MTIRTPGERFGGRSCRDVGRAVGFAAAGLVVLASCSAVGAPPERASSVVAIRVDVPLHHPVWSHSAGRLLAVTEDGSRIAKIAAPHDPGSPSSARAVLSEPLRDIGENVATSPTGEDVVYVPQPRLDRVAVVGVATLRPVGTLQAGPSPSYVSTDFGSRMLLAAPPDGSTVTAVDLRENKVLPSQEVLGGPLAEVDGGKRGRRIGYHVAGPDGISHYKGSPLSVKKKGEMSLSVESSAGDLVKPTRVYVAVEGTDRLVAVDSKRSLHGMEVVGRTSVGEPIRHVGVDETRVYAATERTLVVFETNSFEGYADTIPVVDTIDYRSALPSEELEAAPLSGLAVGADRVYLTFFGQPYIVSVAKPSL